MGITRARDPGDPWRWWFAWHPVTVQNEDGRWVRLWWLWVERWKEVTYYSCDHYAVAWHYRLPRGVIAAHLQKSGSN